MVNPQGYANPGQLAAGIHTRLYARAYIIADANDSRCISAGQEETLSSSYVVPHINALLVHASLEFRAKPALV